MTRKPTPTQEDFARARKFVDDVSPPLADVDIERWVRAVAEGLAEARRRRQSKSN
jgi:hypothetical protein